LGDDKPINNISLAISQSYFVSAPIWHLGKKKPHLENTFFSLLATFSKWYKLEN